ncbi:MAG: hypothetical protein QM644_13935 [Mobilitalea sp.]
MIGKLIIRRKPPPVEQRKNIIIYFISVTLLGFILGIVSKYSDTIPSNHGLYGAVLHCISYITTELGIWIFLATVIAMYSYNHISAMINTTSFFLAMLTGYYLFSRYVCGFYSINVIIYWVTVAFISSLGAFIVWFGKGSGWLSNIFAAMPIGVLFALGYNFFNTIFTVQCITRLLNIIFAFLLLILFSKGNGRNKGYVLFVIALILCFILSKFHIIGLLYGGF